MSRRGSEKEREKHQSTVLSYDLDGWLVGRSEGKRVDRWNGKTMLPMIFLMSERLYQKCAHGRGNGGMFKNRKWQSERGRKEFIG